MFGFLVWALEISGGFVALAAVVLAIAFLVERHAERTDRARFPAPGRLIDVDGRRLHLLCAGSGDPTVVLEAGGGEPSVLLMPVFNRVARTTRACAYDRAGFGWSDPAPGERDFDDRARDLHRLLKAAEVPPPYVLVGESFGGLVVRAFARLHPGDVAAVVLVDAAEEAQVFAALDALRRSARRQRLAANLLVRSGLLRWALVQRPEAVGIPGAALSADERKTAARLLSRPEHWRAAMGELIAYERTAPAQRAAGGFGGLGDLPLIVIAHGRPMRGVHAALEAGWRSGQDRLAALSTQGKLVIAARSGHAISLTDPDLVAASIEEVVSAVRLKSDA